MLAKKEEKEWWTKRQTLPERGWDWCQELPRRPMPPFLWETGALLSVFLMRLWLPIQRWSIFVIMCIVPHRNPIRGDCLNRGGWLNSQIYCKTTLGVVENGFHCWASLLWKKKNVKLQVCTLYYPSLTDHKTSIPLHVVYSSPERLKILLPGSQCLPKG